MPRRIAFVHHATAVKAPDTPWIGVLHLILLVDHILRATAARHQPEMAIRSREDGGDNYLVHI